jgi:hypothetical protein
MIARRRKRARVHSISLRTFHWLVYHEAAWRILNHDPDAARQSRWAVTFLTWSRSRIRREVEKVLYWLPARRGWP